MDGISSLVVPSFGIDAPAAGGAPTLSGTGWGTQDAAGYWSGWGSPVDSATAASIAAKTAADRQAIADFEAALRAQAPTQEVHTPSAASFGPGYKPASTSTTDTSGLKSLAPLLLMSAAFGGSPTVVQNTPAPVVGAAQFSDRRKPRGYAGGGKIGYADIAQQLQKAGVGGGTLMQDGYMYVPVWNNMSGNPENGGTGQLDFSHFLAQKQTDKYGDEYGIYDPTGKKTGTGIWEAPDLMDKLGPALALSLIGYAGGQALFQGLGGGSGVSGSAGPSGLEAFEASQGLGSAGSGGLSDLAAMSGVGEAGLTEAQLSAMQAANASGGVGGLDFSKGYTDSGTAGGALDTNYATGAAGTPYTTTAGGPVLPNGSGGAVTTPTVTPTPPAPTSIVDKIANAGSGFLDKILSDPFKAAGLLALLAGAKDIGGGGGGSGQYAGYAGGIPTLTASRSRIARDNTRRPGSAPQRAFTDVKYGASGGIVGLLKGGGTGMSDSIPATIDGNQPARLARDEFVVPADVVSALGEGSSDAGAEVLDKMMQRVRHAAHGKTDQQRRVNPQQVLPA